MLRPGFKRYKLEKGQAIDTMATSFNMVLSSEVRLIDLVHSAAEKVAQLAGFDEDDALNIGLAVREGAINAMVHGNQEDPDLRVDVLLTADDDGFSALISDEGEGFDPDAPPDPTETDNLLMTSGRGLLLMRAFVDEVVYKRREQRGMQVTMRKRLKVEDKGINVQLKFTSMSKPLRYHCQNVFGTKLKQGNFFKCIM